MTDYRFRDRCGHPVLDLAVWQCQRIAPLREIAAQATKPLTLLPSGRDMTTKTIRSRVLASGLYFGEDPRWRGDRLWLSDFFGQTVYSVSLQGDLRPEIKLDDWPSGIGWMPDGSMLIVSMQKKQVLRRSEHGGVAVHADLGAVAGGQCNDMVVDRNGRAYVGNFGFDLYGETLKRGAESALAEHPKAAIARILPDGSVDVVATEMDCPNGSVITPDGKVLIVAETLAARISAFDIEPDGSLSNRRVWAPLPGCAPDGITLDAEGNIWIANANAAECIHVAPGGKILEIIDTGDLCFACMLGGDDGRSLFMLTAPAWIREEAKRAPMGKLLITRVQVPHTGLP